MHRRDYCQMVLGYGAKRSFSVGVWAITGQIQALRKPTSRSGEWRREENEAEERGKQTQQVSNKRDPERTET